MALLIDNDIIHKLAQLDLLKPAYALLREMYGSIAVLKTLTYKFCPKLAQKRRRVENRYGEDVISRIEDFLNEDVVLVDIAVQNEVLIEAMGCESNLDAGEMQLLQAMIDSKDDLMFTGDKRFLKAICDSETLKDTLSSIAGSFVCFEQVMICLIKRLGFELVKSSYLQALTASYKIDKTLTFCFEGGENAEEERVLENLQANVKHIEQKQAPTLLCNKDDWAFGLA